MEKVRNGNTNSNEMVSISRAEYEFMQAQIQWLMEQPRLRRRKQFGASSEKSTDEGMEQLSLLFDEAEVYTAQEAAGPVAVAAHVRNRKSGSVRDILPENIPVEVVEHRLSEEERSCPQCGELMAGIGTEVRETLKFIPAKAVLQRDVYYTYACRNCERHDISTPVVKTPKEPAVIPGGFASAETVAHIMMQKFVMGAPLYRQEREWSRQGIQLSRQTMSNWMLRCAKDWLEPVYEEPHRQLVKRQVLHADETTLQVLHKPGKKPQSKSYMWLYRTSGDTERPIVLYEYQPDRKKEHPKEFLAGFRGYLHTDGYSGYHDLPESITAWAAGLMPDDISMRQ